MLSLSHILTHPYIYIYTRVPARSVCVSVSVFSPTRALVDFTLFTHFCRDQTSTSLSRSSSLAMHPATRPVPNYAYTPTHTCTQEHARIHGDMHFRIDLFSRSPAAYTHSNGTRACSLLERYAGIRARARAIKHYDYALALASHYPKFYLLA